MKKLSVFALVGLALAGCSTGGRVPPTCVTKIIAPQSRPPPAKVKLIPVKMPCDCKCPVPGAVTTASHTEEADKPAPEPVKVGPPRKPGPTLLLGDSMLWGFTPRWVKKDLHTKLDAERIEIIAEGAQKTQWLRTKLQLKDSYKKGEYYEDWKIAIVSIGANDLGERNSILPLSETKENLKVIYQVLHKHKVLVFACTVAPSYGNTSGDWALDFEGVEKDRNDLNDWIRTYPLVHHVIDLAAPVDKGGLADNNDPKTMAMEVRMWGAQDAAHAKLDVLIEIFRRELAIGMNKKEAASMAPPYE